MRLPAPSVVLLALLGAALMQGAEPKDAPKPPAPKPLQPPVKPEIKVVNGRQIVVIGKMEFDLQQGVAVMRGPNGATFTMAQKQNKVEVIDAGRKIVIVEQQDKSQIEVFVTEPRAPAQPAAAAEAERAAALIKDLDSDAFPVRQSAQEGLEKLGLAAESALRGALTARPSLETRQRIEAVLQRLEPQPTVFKARNAKELLKTQPAIYKLYEKWMIDEWAAAVR